MSVVVAADIPISIPGAPFAKAFPRFDELGQAGQRLWMFLWDRTAFGTKTIRITDREIANACGRGIRWVQKALAQLLDFEIDGEPTPVIDRSRKYGPRDIAGRVIRIIVEFARPAEAPTTTRARAKPRPGATTKPTTPTPAKSATPPPPPEPKPTPEEARKAADLLRTEIARIKAETDATRAQELARQAAADQPSLPSKPIKGVDPNDLNYLEVKERLGALTEPEKARLDAARANRGP